MAQKWSRNLQGATAEITAGVNAVTVAPGQRAAAQKAVWLARVTAAQDKWARNVASVTLEDWRQKMLQVGIPRVAQGAQANQDKVQRFMGEFLPYLDRGVANVKAMPKTTMEDSIQRAVTMMRWNAGFKRSGSAATGA